MLSSASKERLLARRDHIGLLDRFGPRSSTELYVNVIVVVAVWECAWVRKAREGLEFLAKTCPPRLARLFCTPVPSRQTYRAENSIFPVPRSPLNSPGCNSFSSPSRKGRRDDIVSAAIVESISMNLGSARDFH